MTDKEYYKIEKDIPIPKGKNRKWGLIVQQMEVGDSVRVPTESERSGLIQAMRSNGMKYKSVRFAKGDIRIWRVENDK